MFSNEQQSVARSVAQQLAEEFSSEWNELDIDLIRAVDEILKATPSTEEDIKTRIAAASLAVSIAGLALNAYNTFKQEKNCEPTYPQLIITVSRDAGVLSESSDVKPEIITRITEITVNNICARQ